MAAQLSALFRQGIVRPLDEEAREVLHTLFVDRPIRCEWLSLSRDGWFELIWDAGLFQEIGAAINEPISEYEEIVIDPGRLDQVVTIASRHARDSDKFIAAFAQKLAAMANDAKDSQTPLFFVL